MLKSTVELFWTVFAVFFFVFLFFLAVSESFRFVFVVLELFVMAGTSELSSLKMLAIQTDLL